MVDELVLHMADFSCMPGGRYRDDSVASGEEYREDVLLPALRVAERVVVDLDGVIGCPSGFLEEIFGGAVRELGADATKRVVPKAIKFPGRQEYAEELMARALQQAAAAPLTPYAHECYHK